MKTNTAQGIIYVEVPHTTKAKAYGFSSEADFTSWLQDARPIGFSYESFTREEWQAYCAESGEEEGSDYWKEWAQPGFDLFDQGEEKIVVIWYHETAREIFKGSEAPDENKAILDAIDDFHAQFVLDHDRALKVINGRELCRHQAIEIRFAVEDEARKLGWIEEEAEEEEEAK